jgi:uncharacterized protein GlcG (DUF336 family)
MTLTLEAARKIIAVALATARAHKMLPLAVLVVDAGGHPVAFEKEDGAPAGRFAIAHGKANACVMMGAPGSVLQGRAVSDSAFSGALTSVYGGNYLPRKGGVLIRNGQGTIIGALGVTGDTSDNDALCGVAGIEAVGLVAEA